MRHIIWRNRASAILGILLVLVPFSGLPLGLKNILVVLCGFLIAVFGFYHGSTNYVLTEEDNKEEEVVEEETVEEVKKETAFLPEVKIKRHYHRNKKSDETLPDGAPSDQSL